MDSWRGIGNQPITLNKYLYANADPGNMVDPTGNFSLGSMMSAVNIAFTLSTIATADYGSVLSGESDAMEVGSSILFELIGGRFKYLKLFSKVCGKKNKKGGCSPIVSGGRYSEVKKYQKKRKKKKKSAGEVHHTPSQYAVRATSISTNRSPAIWMERDHHKQTASHNSARGTAAASLYRGRQRSYLKNDSWCAAIAMDVDDIRSKRWGYKYEGSIRIMQLALPAIIGKTCSF